MRFSHVKAFIVRHPAAGLGVAAFLLYLPWLGAADLVTDEAKSALNIAYPHPPLVRWMMAASQAIFGTNNFAVRLPVVIFGAVGVAVMYLLLMRLFDNRKSALIGATIFALLPAWVDFSRTGYLSVPLATCALVMLLGIARLSERHDDKTGHRLLFIGLAVGLWCQLQAVLLVPVWAWWVWRNRATLRTSPRALAYVALGAAQIVAFGLYILSSPQILADTFAFARGGSSLVADQGGGVHGFGWLFSSAGAWVIAVVALLLLNLLLRRGHLKQPEGMAIGVMSALFVVLFFSRAANYYTPYLAAMAVPLAVLLSTKFEPHHVRAFGASTAIVCLFLLPLAYATGPTQTFWRRNTKEFSVALKGEHDVIVLGLVGYDAQFYLPVPMTKWPNDPNRRLSKTVLVFEPQTMTEKEKTVLKGLSFDRLIGPVAVYRIK